MSKMRVQKMVLVLVAVVFGACGHTNSSALHLKKGVAADPVIAAAGDIACDPQLLRTLHHPARCRQPYSHQGGIGGFS